MESRLTGDEVLIVEDLSKLVGRSRPPTIVARIVERLNRRADGLVDDDEDEDLVDDRDSDDDDPLGRPVVAAGATFSLRAGEIVGVLGGSDRSVAALLRVISGMSVLTSGSVRVAGRVVYASDSAAEFFPRDGSVREAVKALGAIHRIPPQVTRRRLPEILAFAGLHGQHRRRVEGLGRPAIARLALSVGLHSDADVLLFHATDRLHSMSGDPFVFEDAVALVEREREAGRAIVHAVAYRTALIAGRVDRVLAFADGRLVDAATDTSAEADRALASQGIDVGELRERPRAEWGMGDGQVAPDGEHGGIAAASLPGLVVEVLSPRTSPTHTAVQLRLSYVPSVGQDPASVRFAVSVGGQSATPIRFIQSEPIECSAPVSATVSITGATANATPLKVQGAVEVARGTTIARIVGKKVTIRLVGDPVSAASNVEDTPAGGVA